MTKDIVAIAIMLVLSACVEPPAPPVPGDTCMTTLTPEPAFDLYEVVFRVSEPVEWQRITHPNPDALLSLVEIVPDGSSVYRVGEGVINAVEAGGFDTTLDTENLYRLSSDVDGPMILTLSASDCAGIVTWPIYGTLRPLVAGVVEGVFGVDVATAWTAMCVENRGPAMIDLSWIDPSGAGAPLFSGAMGPNACIHPGDLAQPLHLRPGHRYRLAVTDDSPILGAVVWVGRNAVLTWM